MVATTIKFGGYQPPASVHSQAAERFGAALKDQLGDDLKFELDGDIVAAGKNAAELLTMVESGALTMCYFSTSYLAERVPEFSLLDLPFLIEDRDHAYDVLDGKLGDVLAERLAEATEFRLLGLWDNGFRHFSNSLRPIRTPGDCRGMRIRTLSSELHADVFRLLGFDPVAMDVKDLVSGVHDGTIDAQENPLTNTYNFGIHKHHRYVTLSSHFFGAAGLLCHGASYDAWPSRVRDAVLAAAADATAYQRGLATAEDDKMLPLLVGEGAEIIELGDDDRAAFREAVAPVLDAQRARFGETLFGHLG